MTLTRREGLQGGAALVATTVLFTEPADAIHINLKKVATVLVQGINIAVNPAAQVGLATKILSKAIEKISPNAHRTLEVVSKIASLSTDLSGGVSSFATGRVLQALPLFANVGYQLEQVSMFADQSNRRLNLTSSAEQHLIADPSGYVSDNANYLTDFVRSGFVRTPYSYNVPPGSAEGRPIAATPTSGPGFYPSVIQLSEISQFVSLFRV